MESYEELFKKAKKLFENGKDQEAFNIFYKLSEIGDLDAKMNLAYMYSFGHGCRSNNEQAFEIHSKVINENYEYSYIAQYELGFYMSTIIITQ